MFNPKLLMLVLICVAAYCVMRQVCVLYRKIMTRHYAAIKLAAALRSYGLVRIPTVLEAYGVGDVPTAVHEIEKFVHLLEQDETVVLKEFDSVFSSVLNKKLATAEGRALVSQMAADAGKSSDTPTKATA